MSRTDSEAGYMYRDQKPEGFFWLSHRTVDAKHNFIVDVHVTPGNVSDSTVYLDRITHILDRFDFPLEAVINVNLYMYNFARLIMFNIVGFVRRGLFRPMVLQSI